ncbi:hypothetical protein ACHAWF_008863 [Thalassiosira exigua]
MVETNDEWIVERTGIKERRIVEKGTGVSDLFYPAVMELLEKRGITAEELDAIIVGTTTPDMVFPSAGCLLQEKIGAKNAFCYDLQAACSGFLYGKQVFKRAVKEMADVFEEKLDKNNMSGDDVDLFVAHQANIRIIEAAAKRMKLPEEKVMINIQKYGNTTSGTIPIALSEAVSEGRLKKGDTVVLAAFGGGYTWGSMLLKWGF